MPRDRNVPPPPEEPILEMNDIQGIAVPGFFKPHHTLLYVRIPESRDIVMHFKKLLHTLAGEISTAAETLADRRKHRRAVSSKTTAGERATKNTVLTAIGFSSLGLARMTPSAAEISSEAFQEGLVQRSSLLGDPTTPGTEGHPSTWKVGGPGNELDALFVVAGTDRNAVTARAQSLLSRIVATGVAVDVQLGDVRTDLPGHEHFGFDDGVSQPGIRGRASTATNDFITDRHVSPAQTPESWLYGYPGQDLVWPGEFVLGYPSTSPDPYLPGPDSPTQPAWTRNGSFLVYRRLRQDVTLFWRTMNKQAEKLGAVPGFPNQGAEWLASHLVGRWPSGAPVSRTPHADNGYLGSDKLANNYFLFDSDTTDLKLIKASGTYPMAKADPIGATCPLAAHIRKVNIRDSSSDMGARSSTYDRRILRVGVPFGKPLAVTTESSMTSKKGRKPGGDELDWAQYLMDLDDPEQGNRGLLFLSIQSSIEEQFEFLQARWINDDSRPKMPGGNDMIVGQNAPTQNGARRCGIFGSELQQAQVEASGQWVIPTGGGYFFVPSISALRDVIAQ
jgi:Dyp-type peroxidase family